MGRKATILIEGKTIREIAAELGMREATVRTRAFPGCTLQDIMRPRYESVVIDGMTLAEISKMTGISKNTLYWRYRHGRTGMAALTAGRYGCRIPRK